MATNTEMLIEIGRILDLAQEHHNEPEDTLYDIRVVMGKAS